VNDKGKSYSPGYDYPKNTWPAMTCFD